MNRLQSIALIIPYFGVFPEWAHLFFETVRRNSTIDFHIFTDIAPSYNLPPNVYVHHMSFSDYIAHANKFVDFDFSPPNAYKLCDLRPLFGVIHLETIREYDFYGWTDMDILFGDIRSFYTEDILNRYEILSTHAHRISGHMALFKNIKKHREKYLKIYQWKEALQNQEFVGIDEHGITNAYLYSFWEKAYYKFGLRTPKKLRNAIKQIKSKKMYLKEQFTTPFLPRPWLDGTINSSQPDTWYYVDGQISNSRDGNRNFIYLHLMNFKSNKWRHDGTPAPWAKLDKIACAEVKDMITGIQIDKNGINPIV
ncbi:hypothetical protein O3Q51_00445 [Cryomorphaceae bacterium 1068]|nr:hypothetical protein [Cryomorphaceae bacterium 1068]